jgi:uncharacterized iron-regulated membrane protein
MRRYLWEGERREMRFLAGALLAALAIAALSLLPACGGGSGSEPKDGTALSMSETVASKLATALGLDGPDSILWEDENTTAWKDAQLFSNRILGDTDVPSLEEMEIDVLEDETAGDGRTVAVRVSVADLTADYRISMREVSGQWRITSYEVEEIVEAMGR